MQKDNTYDYSFGKKERPSFMNKKNSPALNQQEIRKSNVIIQVTQDEEEEKD